MDQLAIGVIGVGEIARMRHLPNLVADDRVRLTAFCDPDQEVLHARAQDYGVSRTFSDHHELLAEDLDALCIFVPPHRHTDAEIIAAERGLPFIVEKPPTISIAKAREIAAAVEGAGVIAGVAFNLRYSGAAEAAREILTGRRVVQALAQRLHGSGAKAAWWMRRAESGGAFVENTIHVVDLLRYLIGEIETIAAFVVERPDSTRDLDIPLSHCVNYEFECGAVANVTTSTALTRGGRSNLAIIADEDIMELSGPELRWAEQEVECPERDSYAEEMRVFVDAVISGNPRGMRSPYADGIKSLGAVLAADVSSRRGGEPIKLAEYLAGGSSLDADD